ncbi:MAG: hypothetical protein AAFX01_00720 [Cyanobacteria bacterium J06638_28]
MEEMELYRRLAALERRVNKLEAGMQEIDRIVDPQGWIGEAFHVLESHVDAKFAAVDANFASMDVKLDIILRHITGLEQSSDNSE